VVTGGRRTLNATKAVVVERSACVILSKSRDKDHKESEDKKFEHDRRQILKLELYQNQQNFFCFCWLAAQLQQLHFPGKMSGTSGNRGKPVPVPKAFWQRAAQQEGARERNSILLLESFALNGLSRI
jgi:hypothetical protein